MNTDKLDKVDKVDKHGEVTLYILWGVCVEKFRVYPNIGVYLCLSVV